MFVNDKNIEYNKSLGFILSSSIKLIYAEKCEARLHGFSEYLNLGSRNNYTI